MPAWFLLPGLGAFLTSLAFYVQYQRDYPASGLDLGIYRQGAQAFLDGLQVYDLRFTLDLPYTYPPVTLPLLAPLAGLDMPLALHVLTAISVAAIMATVWIAGGLMGHHGTAGRIGVAFAVTGLAVWLEPVSQNLGLGQINALLMLLVVADLALPDRVRWKGIGVGVATACKLVPGIFVVYLVLTRRFRAAAVACGAFAVMTLIGWLAAPEASTAYWLHGLFLDSTRVSGGNGPAFVANQSLRGLALRSFGETTGAAVFWVVSALVVAVAGLGLAVLAHRRGEETTAVVTVAFTALLVSPVSWSHHWVWVVVLLPLLMDIALRMDGWAQIVVAGLAPLWTMVLLMWPLQARPEEARAPNGVIWVAYRHDQPVQWFGEHVYVLAVLATMLLAAWWLRNARGPEAAAAATTAWSGDAFVASR
ncbi:MAG TPA: glycosyltransferase 87 family protein [Pseudonocardia sp.]|nr:glycosyltransferase 87 family protein [Pseudonocardia sp.]